MSMIRRNSQLCGQAMIADLQQKGFPEVALHFVKDERTQFNLAVESGNIQIAVASAKEIDEKDHWYRLGVEALRQGNAGIVEYAYQRTKNFERLSIMYLVTGNLEKLTRMLKIAAVQNDVMGQFHNALNLGDWREELDMVDPEALENGDMTAMLEATEAAENEEEGGWDLEDLELHAEVETPIASAGARVFVVPTPGMPVSQIWVQRSSLAAEHAAAGNFDTAMRLLDRQLGIKNFAPLKSFFLELHSGSYSYLRAFSSTPVISLAIELVCHSVRGPSSIGVQFLSVGREAEGWLQSHYFREIHGSSPPLSWHSSYNPLDCC